MQKKIAHLNSFPVGRISTHRKYEKTHEMVICKRNEKYHAIDYIHEYALLFY